MTDFFKHGNKVYSENLNDGILVGNSFDWTVDISLPGDTGGVFPNSTTVVKAKVADCSITPNSNLSIGETITNNAGSSQVYRLTVYPNFNRYGGFTSVSLVGDGDVIITEVGASAPIRNNLDYSNLGDVVELKQLKEYDIVVTIPSGGVVTGLGFGFKSSSADVTASINQSNVTGLESALTGLNEGLDDVETGVSNNLSKINTLSREVWNNTSQTGTSRIDSLVDSVNSLDTSITNLADATSWKYYINNDNYKVRYNDYRVNVDVSLTRTNAGTTLAPYGAVILSEELRPRYPVSAISNDGNVLVQIKDNDSKLYSKSMTGSSLSNINVYAHLEWDRR